MGMIDDGGIVALARPAGQCGLVTQYMLCLGSDLGDPLSASGCHVHACYRPGFSLRP